MDLTFDSVNGDRYFFEEEFVVNWCGPLIIFVFTFQCLSKYNYIRYILKMLSMQVISNGKNRFHIAHLCMIYATTIVKIKFIDG